ncbi:MAG: nuclear transport factor 2 family protein [Flavobacterium lindanitolerans]|uniref:nuclear transport factor 2 family protein n=1 Tax=Flavobacterium lindanitolerans TaxID=428988 RepID=UPI001A4AD7C4|nr:nuclear transport factor 2 family protein [Flavobacterium lindanitolerans]MBL7869740.1 nuclear transport factor 2 family protein [Flavobacterium lindanitolerans]
MSSLLLTEQKILEIENQLREAMKKSDVEILEQLLHDDLLFVLPSGEVITKKTDLETHQSGNLVLEEITSSIDSIKQIDENVVVTLSSKLKGKMLQQNFEGNFRYLRVWKMFDGQLKVIAGSCVAV